MKPSLRTCCRQWITWKGRLEHTSDSENFKAFADGLGLIRDSFLAALGKHGVEEIDAVGKDFDPNFHEAMMQVEGKRKKTTRLWKNLKRDIC